MEFEVMYRELAHFPDILRALLTDVTQSEAQIRPTPEAWSILEVVCHLADEERNDFRPRLDIMLNRPSEAFAPNDSQGVMERKYNERDLAESLQDFLSERQKSLEWLKGFSGAEDWEAVYTTLYRSMKTGDMLGSWVTHDILHLRQLVELRYARVLRLTAPYDVGYAGGW